MMDGAAKHYPDLLSLLVPFMLYTRLLLFQAQSSKNVVLVGHLASGFANYTSALLEFSQQYGWSAVLRYHVNFHLQRLSEMRRGVYDGWMLPKDGRMMSEFSLPYCKIARNLIPLTRASTSSRRTASVGPPPPQWRSSSASASSQAIARRLHALQAECTSAASGPVIRLLMARTSVPTGQHLPHSQLRDLAGRANVLDFAGVMLACASGTGYSFGHPLLPAFFGPLSSPYPTASSP